MHTTSDLGANVPAFLAKLWKMVEDPKTNSLISWAPNGRSFFIRNQSKFTMDLLPIYYKHNNMASFIRQLNMYGFHKKVSVELGGLKCDKDEIEFAHQYFCKDQPYLVEKIKRKVANKNQDTTLATIKPELVSKMLAEVKNMRGRQENMDSTLNEMKLENATLWRELAMLRQKHLKQQQIINKLIQFLVTLVQPSRSGLSVKRRYPLMINDSSRSHKQTKLSKSQECPMGPVIHELDASEPDVDLGYNVAEILESKTPNVQSPQEHNEIPTDDEINMETIQFNKSSIENPTVEVKKKRVGKHKKKRKNKVPVRILIPSLENGKKSRTELHMLEISTDEDEPVTLLKNKPIDLKPVPMATMRSSKLAAMAANIKSQDDNDIDNDIDIDGTPADLEDNMESLDNDASMMKLEDILIVPEMLDNSNIQNNVRTNQEDNSNYNKINKKPNQVDGERSILMTSNNEQRNENKMEMSLQKENNNCDKADPSSSKDLSVSRVTSGMAETNYRDEMDNHLECMQTDLDNLRELLRDERYSIDSNTLYTLFNTDDMYGLPFSSELNVNCKEENNDHIISDSANRSAGGELMAYNPSSSLLDFDDDMLLGNASSSNQDLQLNLYADPLSLEDTKSSLFEALTNNNANTKS
ncbi:hypothetical protein PUN28_017172 [Cardiocondyla obscurior]|uniref:HSF-type DNA-binding domain-containing protein n=1 Tax=Cardiocondyla obscurior TaxID=286306 RepID=A0AAW2EKK3_9HYME